MATTFRLLGSADADTLAQHLAAWHHAEGAAVDPATFHTPVTRLLSDSHAAHAWLIEQGGTAAGYVVLSFRSPQGTLEPRAYVSALYVKPAHRGRGIGRQALHLMADVGQLLQVRVLHFGTDGEDKHAQLLHRRSAPATMERPSLWRYATA